MAKRQTKKRSTKKAASKKRSTKKAASKKAPAKKRQAAKERKISLVTGDLTELQTMSGIEGDFDDYNFIAELVEWAQGLSESKFGKLNPRMQTWLTTNEDRLDRDLAPLNAHGEEVEVEEFEEEPEEEPEEEEYEEEEEGEYEEEEPEEYEEEEPEEEEYEEEEEPEEEEYEEEEEGEYEEEEEEPEEEEEAPRRKRKAPNTAMKAVVALLIEDIEMSNAKIKKELKKQGLKIEDSTLYTYMSVIKEVLSHFEMD